MGILQEAAIYVGDHVTQPIRAKVVSAIEGKNLEVQKQVLVGALMGDGTINPDIKQSNDAINLCIQTRRSIRVQRYSVKQVTWNLVEKPQSK